MQITWIFFIIIYMLCMALSAEPNDASCKSSDCDSQLDERFFFFFFFFGEKGNVTFIFMPLSVCFNCSGELSHSQLCKLCGVLFVLSAWQTPSSCAGEFSHSGALQHPEIEMQRWGRINNNWHFLHLQFCLLQLLKESGPGPGISL